MKLSLSLILILFCQLICAQDTETESIEALIESGYSNSDEGLDLSELATSNASSNAHKKNLNNISSLDFYTLQVLRFELFEAINLHIKAYGPIRSKYELQTIEGLDSNAISVLLRTFQIGDFSIKLILTQKRQHLLRLKHSYRFEKSLGFKLNDSNQFMGNRSKIALLYNSESQNLDFGFHLEKDAGETEKTMFHSGYLAIKPKNKTQNILLGDQQMAFAQGLFLGTGMAVGKSALVMQIQKNNVGSKPYKSFNETGFIRGLSMKSILFKKLETVYFSGVRLLDSKITADSQTLSYGSIISAGYYRNKKELSSKHQLYQILNGFHTLYKFKQIEIGTGLLFQKIILNPFKPNAFEGLKLKTDQSIRLGIDWKWQIKNKLFFGETVMHKGSLPSFALGLLSTLGKKTDLSFLLRKYQATFDSKLSNGFGASSNNQNEQGIYIGFSTQLPYKISLNYYHDLCQFAYPKFRVDAASFQTEQMLELAYKTKSPFSISFRLKHKQEQQNDQSELPIHSLEKHRKNSFRLHSEFKLGQLRIRNRIETVYYQIEKRPSSIGSLIYQDLQFNCTDKITANIRYTLFGSDDFNSRTYGYENDVPGTFNIPSYIGKGSRVSALIKYQIQKDLQIWIRFARSSYEGIKSTGTGLNLTESPHTSDMNIQLQWKL